MFCKMEFLVNHEIFLLQKFPRLWYVTFFLYLTIGPGGPIGPNVPFLPGGPGDPYYVYDVKT